MGEQRQSVEKLFGDALSMEPEARAAFLDGACHNDPELKHLVEEMLMEDERAGSFLKKPLIDVSATAGNHTDATPLPRGTRLGPYEVVGPIGAGGMGEVYRARDMRLDRCVALKILPAHFSCSPEQKSRFDREARTLSSVSHPHICHLYDVGSQSGTDFLVMELLEGETLAARVKKGPLAA